ncbi:MAG: hypothetical protein ACT4OV_09755 [Microthrixaceae bacterium]
MDNQPPTTARVSPKLVWSRLGGQLGVGLCALGFLLVFLGWNGAASVDRVPSQLPYLLSGGIAGLCFVVLGVGMLVVQNQRADRAALQATLRELQESLERAGLAQGTGDARKPFAKPAPRPAAATTNDNGGADLTQEIEIDALALEPAATKAPRTTKPRTTRAKPSNA